MKNIFLIYSGDFFSISGGYIYNRKLTENLKYWGYHVQTLQISEKQVDIQSEEGLRFDMRLSELPAGSVLLIDSLAFGYNLVFWQKYSHSHILIPLMHLPLFLNPENRANLLLKSNEMKSLDCAAHVVVTSLYTQHVLENEGIAPEKITKIIPGVEVSYRRPQYATFPKQLLCVSGINSCKNQLLLLKALCRLKKYNWTLSLVGSTFSDLDYFLQILKFISANGLNNRVIITGEVTGEELMRVYSHSDLFLFASLLETYGMVVAEALSCGLPVFAYKSEGVHENFSKYPVCFFQDENSLCQLLTHIFEDEEFYLRLSREMVQITPSFPSWEMVAKLFGTLFRKMENRQLAKTFHE